MIKSISIKNFKGIGDEVKIDIKPITLLFGANSAGKSTFLHALHYIYEILDDRFLDVDRTQKGGDSINLGGFKRFVHQRDLSQDVTIGIGCGGLGDEFFVEFYDALANFLHFESYNGGTVDSFCAFESCELFITTSWSQLHERPYVSKVRLVVGEDKLLEFSSDPKGLRVLLDFNEEHPVLSSPANWESDDEQITGTAKDFFDDPDRSMLAYCLDEVKLHVSIEESVDKTFKLYIKSLKDALPNADKEVLLDGLEEASSENSERFTDNKSLQVFLREFQTAVHSLISIPLRQVHRDLDALVSLGPLRESPPPNFRPPRHPQPDRWISGLAAWDLLARDSRGHFVSEVNHWLADRLDCGYSLERRNSFVVDTASSVGQWLASGTGEIDDWSPSISASLVRQSRLVLTPADDCDIELRANEVGTGISQLIPVVTAACLGEEKSEAHYRQADGRLITIEQPEIHVHPKIQAAMGDLFIESHHKRRNQFILETHSEHLILRLLRRIRESGQENTEALQRLRTDDLAIYYLQQEKGSTTVRRIDVDNKGEFIQPWPDDFFEIDFNERFGIDRGKDGGAS
ncbi:DUF3696 domain-containing protein [Mariniblastus sp.]|nr:DUF3696 domain-containing protein [Mariniblastus sp.]